MRWPLLRVAVAEQSMQPTLQPGDWLLVLRTRRVRPGQLVVARHPVPAGAAAGEAGASAASPAAGGCSPTARTAPRRTAAPSGRCRPA